MTELEVGRCHLGECYGVVEGCYGDVAAVEDGSPGEVGIEACAGVEATEGSLAGRSGTYGTGAESCSWAVLDFLGIGGRCEGKGCHVMWSPWGE